MLLAGFAAAIATGLSGAWGYAPLAAWDSAAMVLTVWVWLAIGPMCSSATASHATREDPGHVLTDRIVLIASVASLGAVGFVLVQAGSANGGPPGSARRP